MTFAPTDMAHALREPLARFLDDNYDPQARRTALREGRWARDVWTAFADDLGILGAALPENVGGLGGGPAEIAAIMELCGRNLVIEPILATIVMGAGCLKSWSDPAAVKLLAEVCAGRATLALAHAEETSGYDPAQIATRAEPTADGFVLNGRKALVLNAAQASHLIVVARTAGETADRAGVSIFVVDAGAAGLARNDYRTIDGGSASDLTLTDLTVPRSALVGREGEGLPLVERVLDEATTAICAEACGVMQKLLDLTVEYTKQREQFGRSISEFQVLQHRMVDMLVEVKQSTSLAAVARLKLETPERAAAVSAAKSRIGRACRAVSQAAVQLHGGIGIADETPVSHYFRRALMIEQQFGSTDFHLDRYERLQLTEAWGLAAAE